MTRELTDFGPEPSTVIRFKPCCGDPQTFYIEVDPGMEAVIVDCEKCGSPKSYSLQRKK